VKSELFDASLAVLARNVTAVSPVFFSSAEDEQDSGRGTVRSSVSSKSSSNYATFSTAAVSSG
jgi:hypothetical protein